PPRRSPPFPYTTLFRSPVYTLSKALSALALADALQRITGVPVAPVFWAATDDTDFKEACSTVVATTGGAQLLRIDHPETLGRTRSEEHTSELQSLAYLV